MKRRSAQIAVPVRPFPELQWMTKQFSGSAIWKQMEKLEKTRKDNFNNLLGVLTLQPTVALLSYLKKEDEGRSMVIWPVIVSNSSAKESFCVISCSLRCINYVVFIVMLSIQKIWYLYRIELIRNLSNAISNLPYQYCCDRGSQNHSKGSSLQLGD